MRVRWIPCAAVLLFAGSAAAGEDAPPVKRSQFVREKQERYPLPSERPQLDERVLAQSTDTVDASQVVEEILDEVAGDLAALGVAELSPLVIERIDLSENLNPGYAALVEARLIAALYREDTLRVVRCLECRATQVDVQGAEWTARQGLTRRADLQLLADGYGAKAVLRGVLTLHRNPDALSFDVEVTRTSDATVLFAEGYRFDPSTSLLYRGTDAARTREERRQDLQARIDGKPSFGHTVLFGGMMVPVDSSDGPVVGAFGSYRLYESFGTYRQYRAGLNLGGFIHSSRLAGAVLQASLHSRIHALSVYGPELFLGFGVGGFITGGGGNTPMGTVSAEYLLGERMAVQASVSWVHPFDFAERGTDVGGVTPQAGVGFLW